MSSIWEEVIYRTSPTNEKKCEAALNFVYAFNHMKPPKIMWFDDHYAAEKYLATQKRAVKVGDKFWQNMYNQLYIMASHKSKPDMNDEYTKISPLLSHAPRIGYPGFGKFSVLNWGKSQYAFINDVAKPESLTRAIDLFDATGYYLTYDLVLAVRNPEYIYISNTEYSYKYTSRELSSNYYIQYRGGPTYCRFLNYNTTASVFQKLDSHQFVADVENRSNSYYTGYGSNVKCKKCGFITSIQQLPNDIYSCDEMVIKDILE